MQNQRMRMMIMAACILLAIHVHGMHAHAPILTGHIRDVEKVVLTHRDGRGTIRSTERTPHEAGALLEAISKRLLAKKEPYREHEMSFDVRHEITIVYKDGHSDTLMFAEVTAFLFRYIEEGSYRYVITYPNNDVYNAYRAAY